MVTLASSNGKYHFRGDIKSGLAAKHETATVTGTTMKRAARRAICFVLGCLNS
jgi:hypothetical protein